MASLTDEATGKHCPILHTGATGNNEIVAHHSVAHMDRRLFITIQATILQASGTFYFAIITDAHILYISGVNDSNMMPDSISEAFSSAYRSMMAFIRQISSGRWRYKAMI